MGPFWAGWRLLGSARAGVLASAQGREVKGSIRPRNQADSEAWLGENSSARSLPPAHKQPHPVHLGMWNLLTEIRLLRAIMEKC